MTVAFVALLVVAAGWVARWLPQASARVATGPRLPQGNRPVARGVESRPGARRVVQTRHHVSTWLAERRRRRSRDADLVALLDELACALRAGLSLVQGLAVAVPSAGGLEPELRRVIAEIERGAGLAEALDRWAGGASDAGVRAAGTALALAARTGAPAVPAAEAVAASARERLAIKGEVRAHAAQARASAVVLSVLPVAFAMVISATDPRVRAVLLGTAAGWACATGGSVLVVASAAWMARIVRSVA